MLPLNSKIGPETYPSIKCDFNFSDKEINFLDCVVYETRLGKLETRFYGKKNLIDRYFRHKSEHCKSLK